MERFELQFASKVTEFSEYKNYYEIKNRVCYYDEPNGNNVILPYDDDALQKAQSLVDMPVQAKYAVNQNGDPDLMDHCVAYDDNGNVSFLTASVGVHTGVEIKDDTVVTFNGETKTLPCLFATAKIWKRYPNYCAAIKRLYDEGNLHSSWELSSFSFNYENGVKTLGDYIFDANCFLGSNYTPAYGQSAEVLELSSIDGELMIASALSRDIASVGADDKDNAGKEEKHLEGKNETIQSEIEMTEQPIPAESSIEPENVPAEETPVESEVSEVEENAETNNVDMEVSALTTGDLYARLNRACREAYGQWCYPCYVFPEEHTCWCVYDGESELDYLLFSYTVNGDEVSVGAPEKVRLAVAVNSVNAALEEKNDIIAAANEKIEELSSQIEELMPFKAAYDEAEAKRIADEQATQVAALKKYAEDSKCFTSDELESTEFADMFSALDVAKVKELISDRVVAKLRDAEPQKEISTAAEPKNITSSLYMDDTADDYLSVARQFLHG